MTLTPVRNYAGTVTKRGNDYGVVLQDYTMAQRESPLNETNATQPLRPIDGAGRVSPQGKIIVSMERDNGLLYWQMLVDWCGQRNANAMLGEGNGFFDTPGGLMCAPTGGDLKRILGEFRQNGLWYICETFDYNTKPVRTLNINNKPVWRYKNKVVSYARTPHLIVTRTNRRGIKDENETWITSGGVNNVSWKGGKEHWPLVANKPGAMLASKIRLYPKLPCTLVIHEQSIIVDGNLVIQPGVEMTIDALKFRGADTFVRDQVTKLWYWGDRLLVRAKEPYAATAFDYRCFLSFGKTPWMGHSGYRSPEPNWQRVK